MMPKKKNVLSVLLFLAIISSFQILHSQHLSGKYYPNGYKQGKTILFKANNEFVYTEPHKGHGDHFGKIGYGHFTVQKNKLLLDFDLTHANRRSVAEVSIKESPKDSVIISFEVTEKYNANKVFANTIISCSDTGIKDVRTDQEGKANVKLLKSSKSITFTHDFIGHPKLDVTVVPNKGYHIKMEIDPNEPYPIEDKTMIFTLKKIKKKCIVLQQGNEKKVKWIKN